MTGGDETAAIPGLAGRPVVDRGGVARPVPLVGPGIGARELLNGITILDSCAAIGEHFHDCEESVMVPGSDAVAVLGGAEHRLGPGDATWTPAGMPHHFRNGSADRRTRIFRTYASATAMRTLASTGETRPASAEHAADKVIAGTGAS